MNNGIFLTKLTRRCSKFAFSISSLIANIPFRFWGKYMKKLELFLQAFVPPVIFRQLFHNFIFFTAKNHHTTHIVPNWPHPIRIRLERRKFYSDRFFPRTTPLWGLLPRGCFPDNYKLDLFKFTVGCY